MGFSVPVMDTLKVLANINYNTVYYTPKPDEPYYAAMEGALENDVNATRDYNTHFNLSKNNNTDISIFLIFLCPQKSLGIRHFKILLTNRCPWMLRYYFRFEPFSKRSVCQIVEMCSICFLP